MFEDQSVRSKVIAAALRLAAERGWQALALADIAADAGVSLAEVSREFASKSAILTAFSRAVDQAVLEKIGGEGEADEAARDRIFDVLMTRFELMAPHKAGLKRVHEDLRRAPGPAPELVCSALRSQYWMLTAAGIRAEPPEGCTRVPGLLSVYSRVFPVWLADDDPGLARTMAVLDRALRRGEAWLARFDAIAKAACRIAFGDRRRNKRERPSPASANGAEQPGTAI